MTTLLGQRPGPGRRAGRLAALGQTLVTILVTLLVLTTLTACHQKAPTPQTGIREALHRLAIIDRPATDPTYRRAAFGRAWADVDADGCNTRDEVLFATAEKSRPYRTPRQGRGPTDMVAGTWRDLYTQRDLVLTDLKDPAQAQSLPLDHIVSLAESWRYGARSWTAEQRLQLANDPLNLTPTTAALNRDKSDHDPADWTPPRPGRCDYASRYIQVKLRYRLPVDPQEKKALDDFLDTCPG